MPLDRVWFLGLMHEMHKDPKSGAILCVSQCVSVSVCQCVSVSVCHFEDETTRDRSLRYNKLAGRLGTSNCQSLFFKYRSFVGHCFLHILGTVSPLLGKFSGALRRKLVAFVQGKLSCISKLLCQAVYDWISFFPFEN